MTNSENPGQHPGKVFHTLEGTEKLAGACAVPGGGSQKGKKGVGPVTYARRQGWTQSCGSRKQADL